MSGAQPEALLLTPDFPPAQGGVQRLLHRLARDATRVRFRVVTLASRGDGPSGEDDPFPVIRVAERGARPGAIGALNARGFWEGARRRPDVVVSGHVVTSPAAVALRRALGRRTIQYVYAMELATRPRLARFALARADLVIALSRYARDLAVSTGARPERVRVIPPGVDVETAPVVGPAAPRRRQDARPPRIVTVARLGERYKGHDVLARALPLVRARVPGVEWVVIGDGPLRPHLEELARSHGVDGAIRFAGEVSDQERDRMLADADVFAMPSRIPPGGAGEGFGIAYLEAGLHGLPVVAGAEGGALDAVDHSRTGLLVDPHDHVAIADAISGLLLDPDQARRLGEAGAEHARGFAWHVMVSRVEDLILEACGRSS